MTKEPNKDFRQAVSDILSDYCAEDKIETNKATNEILALCKEMLVPEEKDTSIRHYCTTISFKEGWNACRSELLKQLGE